MCRKEYFLIIKKICNNEQQRNIKKDFLTIINTLHYQNIRRKNNIAITFFFVVTFVNTTDLLTLINM